MTKRRLTPAQVDVLSDGLRTALGQIEAGDLTASASMRYRIEGALVALDVVRGGEARELIERLSSGTL